MSGSELCFLQKQFNLTDRDLSKPLSEVNLDKISNSLHLDWTRLPPYLGLKHGVTEDIERSHRGEAEKRQQFFWKWKSVEGAEATYGKLILALLEIERREDAENICEILTQDPPDAGKV